MDDLYFDDEGWTVRYMVVGTGGQISPRKALVTASVVSEANAARRVLHTEVTREQLENGPGLEAGLPWAAQREADYYAYHGTEPYWAGWLSTVPGPSGARHTRAFPVEPPAGQDG